MIQYSALLPTHHLGDFADLMDYDFLEPIPDPRYTDYYYHKAPTAMRLLDNGLIEFGASIINTLYEYAKHVHATHVVSPDRLGDWNYNRLEAQRFSKSWPKQNIYVCLGGPSPQQFYDQSDWCFEQGFGGVCLPYRLNRVPVGFFPRIHMLGLRIPERWHEFARPQDAYESIISLDTTEPINAAFRGIEYRNRTVGGIWTTKRLASYQDYKADGLQIDYALSNIRFLKEAINARKESRP